MLKLFIFLLPFINAWGQIPVAPGLEYIASLKVNIGKPIVIGETVNGTRRVIPITGGKVQGPKLNGEIMSVGADWQVVNEDFTRTDLEALYQIRTNDSVLIFIRNKGIRTSSPEVGKKLATGISVNSDQYYFRAAPVFEAPAKSNYQWMNNALFICKGIRMPDHVLIELWKVL